METYFRKILPTLILFWEFFLPTRLIEPTRLFNFGNFSYLHVISNCALIKEVRVHIRTVKFLVLFTFGSFDTILTARGSFAVVDSHGGDDNLPIFERQFLGGARDLRGFQFRDIGPRDATGPNATQEVLGGATSVFGSLEFTFPVIGQVRGAVFYDAGFVNSDSWDFNRSFGQ